MASVSESIQHLILLCREQGIEPNRVRMGREVYGHLFGEMLKLLIEGEVPPTVGQLDEIHGLAIELPSDCPPDNIYVDRRTIPGDIFTVQQMRYLYGDAFMDDFFEQANDFLRSGDA